MKILVADDSPSVLFTMKQILSAQGHEVLEADSGLKALRILTQTGPPLLAILDWLMPDMDGTDVCQRVRQAPLEMQPYIILLTAKNSKEDQIHGLGMGANDYISKPFHEGELQARIAVGARVISLESALADRVKALEAALAEIKTLQGILPICMYCHKIRDDHDSWQKLESYISLHSEAQFSHGVCPDCMKKFAAEWSQGKG